MSCRKSFALNRFKQAHYCRVKNSDKRGFEVGCSLSLSFSLFLWSLQIHNDLCSLVTVLLLLSIPLREKRKKEKLKNNINWVQIITDFFSQIVCRSYIVKNGCYKMSLFSLPFFIRGKEKIKDSTFWEILWLTQDTFFMIVQKRMQSKWLLKRLKYDIRNAFLDLVLFFLWPSFETTQLKGLIGLYNDF